MKDYYPAHGPTGRDRNESDLNDIDGELDAQLRSSKQVLCYDFKLSRAPNESLMENIPVKHVDCSEHSHPVSKHASDSIALPDCAAGVGTSGMKELQEAKKRDA